MQSIQNDQLTVCVRALGAELCSVKSSDGVEYIWSGDPNVWAGQSPILFPSIGRMIHDQYRLNGTTYDMPKHGFAHGSMFEQIDGADDMLLFELLDSESTLVCWPYRFSFKVRYTIKDNILTIGFEVDNRNDDTMYFSLGAHPAFACPLEADLSYNDYMLEFETAETAGRWFLEDGYIGRCQEKYLDNDKRIDLSNELFADDALIFKNLRSNAITLNSDKGKRGVTVDCTGWPDMGIWSKGTGFVCIEPWFGYNDPVGFDGEVADKPGILTLHAGKKFAAQYSIYFEGN